MRFTQVSWGRCLILGMKPKSFHRLGRIGPIRSPSDSPVSRQARINSRAASRAASVTLSPANMRAISSTRSL